MKWEKDLVKDIRTNSAWDDKDGDCRIMSGDDNPYDKLGGWEETSELSREALKERFLRVRDTCSAILEIGISRNGENSFTQVFLKNKKKETVYIGIDIDDKTYLNNDDDNVFTIRNTSSNIEENMKWINEIFDRCNLERKQFDFILIDGWHSINQCLIDWEYTELLGDTAIVCLHDSAYHPGPKPFVAALNTDIWCVEKNALKEPTDWGIAFAWNKNNTQWVPYEEGYVWDIGLADEGTISNSR
jgi:hypothetical protein